MFLRPRLRLRRAAIQLSIILPKRNMFEANKGGGDPMKRAKQPAAESNPGQSCAVADDDAYMGVWNERADL